MKKNEVLSYFGSSTAVAKELGISKQSISQWGAVIPRLREFEIERITKGKLKANTSSKS